MNDSRPLDAETLECIKTELKTQFGSCASLLQVAKEG